MFRVYPLGYTVSIHAPARGATTVEGNTSNKRKVSIHAPARGATVGVLDAFSERVLEGGIENPQNLTFSFVMFV